MKLTLESNPPLETCVLHCRGRMDNGKEATAFSQKVEELLPTSHRLVVDLGGIEVISRTGLGELFIVLMWAKASGCDLKLAGPSLPVFRLLELAGLLSVFETYATVDEALVSFGLGSSHAKAACSAA